MGLDSWPNSAESSPARWKLNTPSLLCFFARHGETTELAAGGAVVEETKLRGGENNSGVELYWF
jgi:hypothetical protein